MTSIKGPDKSVEQGEPGKGVVKGGQVVPHLTGGSVTSKRGYAKVISI